MTSLTLSITVSTVQTVSPNSVSSQATQMSSCGEVQTNVNTLLRKALELLDTKAIQQDRIAYSILNAKYDELFKLNPNQGLSEQDQEFSCHLSLLLDTNGKVQDFVRNKLAQPPRSSISQLNRQSSVNPSGYNLGLPDNLPPSPSSPNPSTVNNKLTYKKHKPYGYGNPAEISC